MDQYAVCTSNRGESPLGSAMVIPEILVRGIKSEIPGFPLKTCRNDGTDAIAL